MIFKPELGNKSQVLSWYDTRENPCYIVFTGVKVDVRNIFSRWTNDESDQGREKLEQALTFIEENSGNSNTYTIISFPFEEGNENIKVKDIEGESIRFQFNNSLYSQSIGTIPVKESITVTNGDGNYAKELMIMMQRQNEMVLQQLQSFEIRLQEMDDDDEEEEEEIVISGKDRLLGSLAGLLEKPEFTNGIMTIGMGLIGKLFDKKNNDNDSVGQ